MNARVPKSYNQLPTREKEVIARLMEEECERIINEHEVQLFVQYTKLACFVLHNYFGLDEQELLSFIGDFRTVQRKYKNVPSATEMENLVNVEMDKIFKGGFPTKFVEELQRGK